MIKSLAKFALAAVAVSAACGGNDAVQFTNQTFTLQGVVADAVSGQRIGGDLRLYLIQGADVRGPSRLISNTNDALAGEYAFAGIPASTNCNNSSFKVVAVKSGYQRFESEISMCWSIGSIGSTELLDSVLTQIGNIYMFPTGVASPDYRYTVNYQGAPVAGATVQLDPLTQNNASTFSQSGNRLFPTGGYVPALSAQTDASGHVTFPGSQLAVGGWYSVQVLPIALKNSGGGSVQLGLFNGPSLRAGLSGSVTDQLLSIGNLQANGQQLYATSASNRAAGQVTPNGQLVVTFSAPVTMNNPNGFTANMGGGGAAVLAAQPVNASLSADGLTLTLTPNYTTPPASTDKNVTITYGNGTATLVSKDYPANPAYTLIGGSIRFIDNNTINGVVQISGP